MARQHRDHEVSPPENGGGTTPPQASPLVVNDAAAKLQNVQDDVLTRQRQERARLAAQDQHYVRRSYLRAVDPVIVRYRRLLRATA
ncbi:MAG: hypothetical protein M3P91_03265 [Actinomycetota bacterium]|nr:hypothetical protein [Actinomycetota bacterium]